MFEDAQIIQQTTASHPIAWNFSNSKFSNDLMADAQAKLFPSLLLTSPLSISTFICHDQSRSLKVYKRASSGKFSDQNDSAAALPVSSSRFQNLIKSVNLISLFPFHVCCTIFTSSNVCIASSLHQSKKDSIKEFRYFLSFIDDDEKPKSWKEVENDESG